MNKLYKEYFDFINENLNEYPLNEFILSESFTINDVVKKLTNAIEKQKYVGIYYADGTPEEGFRLIEPHVLGQGFKRGDKISNEDKYYLRGFTIMDTNEDEYASEKFKDFKFFGKTIKSGQKISQSVSQTGTGWRLFRVDKITRIKTFSKNFSKLRPDYNPDDKMMVTILSNVPIDVLTEAKSYFE